MNFFDVFCSQPNCKINNYFSVPCISDLFRGEQGHTLYLFPLNSYSIFKCFCPTLFLSLSHRKIFFFNGDLIITFYFLQVWSVSCFLEYVVFSSLYTVVNPRSRVLPPSLRGSSCRCIETGIVFFLKKEIFRSEKTNYGQTK